MNKPEIVFTLPACMGGVASFYYNIINHSHLIKNFYSKVILIKAEEDNRPLFLDKFSADEVITFDYSSKENQYYVQKRLSKLLGEMPGALVTDSSITLSAAGLFNNPKTVFHLVHDYFYVKQTTGMADMIDAVIAHSSFFSDAVFASNPNLFFNRNFFIPYGVEQLPGFPAKNNGQLKLVFIGRLDEGKGVMKLYKIEEGLKKNNVNVNWTIIGKGAQKPALLEQWKSNKNITFCEPDSTKEVYDLLAMQDIFVFPTSFEGTPVSILECMANAVVTITNDLPGGIRDIVKENVGFRCELNNLDQYEEIITRLDKDRERLRQMQKNCFGLSQSSYNIEKNADNYFKIFLQYENFRRDKKHGKVKMSRLDKAFIPNSLVRFVRSIKQ
jgi:glycosyltransferase involved in cell wall biosynthesis